MLSRCSAFEAHRAPGPGRYGRDQMTLQTLLEDMRKRPGSGDVIPVINPVTEEPITEFTDCGEEAVNGAVARARAAFKSGVWSQMPGRERAKVMWRIADLIDEHAHE